ncbi:substrate-binding periplasmic protein [Solimicrobium silvestre]|uniref:Bacterial extracellular solute-binding protein, family 3 n=1 Tax=Solimicrobium silvestre TaxID=2099400 RepID=A0A2S9H2L8_9BURK|nr:transporter substrate-binding domain-containing protein [Solimicrobium silvestre]PRC94221.1 Bacterial extracellular solute-binding protein, family 3 [Solimicrobium silvestre]
MMSQILNVVKICIICTVFSALPAQAEELVVYGGEAFQPLIYLDSEQAAGIFPALFQRLSKSTGDTYKLVLLPWKRAISESAAGKGGITSFTWTEERAKLYDFSEPVYRNTIELTVLKNKAFKFNQLTDLTGKIIGIPLGSSFGDAFDKAVADNLITSDTDPSQVSRLRKLLIGRIDVAIIGERALEQAIRSDPVLLANQNKFTVLPVPLTQDWLYLAFPKTMHKLPALQRFNQALIALKKTKEYQQIIDDNSFHSH